MDKSLITDALKDSQEGNSMVISLMAKKWLENTFENASGHLLYRGLERWQPVTRGTYVQPIIVGSGPSLIEDVETIRRLSWITNPFIISTFTSVSFLVHHGVYPDAIILADSSPSVLEKWNLFQKAVHEHEWTWICAQHVDPKVAEYATMKGRLFTWKSFLKPETDSRAGMYNTAINAMCPLLKTFLFQVGDSINAAIILLENLRNFKQLKFSSILLCGVDHSWNSSWARVPYFTDTEIVATTGWQNNPMQEEIEPGLFTNLIFRMYNEELQNIAATMKDRNIPLFTTSPRTLVGKSIPLFKEEDL